VGNVADARNRTFSMWDDLLGNGPSQTSQLTDGVMRTCYDGNTSHQEGLLRLNQIPELGKLYDPPLYSNVARISVNFFECFNCSASGIGIMKLFSVEASKFNGNPNTVLCQNAQDKAHVLQQLLMLPGSMQVVELQIRESQDVHGTIQTQVISRNGGIQGAAYNTGVGWTVAINVYPSVDKTVATKPPFDSFALYGAISGAVSNIWTIAFVTFLVLAAFVFKPPPSPIPTQPQTSANDSTAISL